MNERLNELKRKATPINKAQKMAANLTMFESLGLDVDDVGRMAESVGLEVEDLLLMDTNVRVVVSNDTENSVSQDEEDLPDEVSTEEAAKLLGVSKDTVLKFKQAGSLSYRNAAPPQSSRPVFRFSKDSVLSLRTDYQTDALPVKRQHQQKKTSRKARTGFSHVRFDDADD